MAKKQARTPVTEIDDEVPTIVIAPKAKRKKLVATPVLVPEPELQNAIQPPAPVMASPPATLPPSADLEGDAINEPVLDVMYSAVPQHVPQIPAANVTQAAKPKRESSYNHGLPYVRMLNRSGVVVPVTTNDIVDRVTNGYQFIHNEPAVPRSIGNPNKPDYPPPYFPRPGYAVRAGGGVTEAVRVWVRAMQEDKLRNMSQPGSVSDEVEWDWFEVHASTILAKYDKLVGAAQGRTEVQA